MRELMPLEMVECGTESPILAMTFAFCLFGTLACARACLNFAQQCDAI
jgi:hypothetical protein